MAGNEDALPHDIPGALDAPGQPVIIIGGPTASGKSGLGLAFARQYDGVIINADSIQLYNALPTLTAHPAAVEQAQAPHRLYGVLDPDQQADARQWRDWALAEIDRAQQQNKLPIIVGGSGFYIKALLEGLSPIPDIPDDQRRAVIKSCEQLGFEQFYAESCARDPKIAGLTDPQNPQRVMRAREVFEATGKSLLDWQKIPKSGPPAHLRFYTLTVLPPRDVLYERCNTRFEQMFDNGALEETAALNAQIKAGTYAADAPVTKAIGFSEITKYLNDETSRAAAIASAAQATRNYAKRQSTWFRNQIKPNFRFDPIEDTGPLFTAFETWRS
ncbi:MAG: tRNA (adenosine(37)-N6)-dimethylallyltransferase MiaA [Pseudomonadota bacterium]